MRHPVTYIQAALREACRRRLMHHLQTRNNDNKNTGWQDMSDIPLHVDMDATMAMLKVRPKQAINEHADGNTPQDYISRARELAPKEKRQLSTIMAGSIRTSARFAHSCKKRMRHMLTSPT